MSLREHLCYPDSLKVTISVGELREFVEAHDHLSDAVEEHVRNCEMYGPMADPSRGSLTRLRAALARHFERK